MSLEKFKESINKYGLARTNQFRIQIHGGFDDNTFLESFCFGMNLPARNISTNTVRRDGAYFELPYGESYEPITLQFYADADLTFRQYFVDWHAKIYDRKTKGLYFYEEYVKEVRLFVIDRNTAGDNNHGDWVLEDINDMNGAYEGNYAINLINAYPKSVSDISFASSNDDIATFSVQFVYERIIEVASSNAGYESRSGRGTSHIPGTYDASLNPPPSEQPKPIEYATDEQIDYTTDDNPINNTSLNFGINNQAPSTLLYAS